MKVKLKNKIIFSTLLAILFFGFFATIIVFNETRDSLFELEKEDIEFIVENRVNQVGGVFNNSRNLVKKIADLSQLKNYLKTNKFFEDEKITQLLKDYNINNQYSAIYLLDNEGTTLVSTDSSFVAQNYSFRDYFREAIQGRSSIDMAIGATSGELGYYFSEPVKENDNILGIVVAKLKPDFIHNSLGSERETDIMLVDNYGIIIFSNDENKIYKSLGELILNTKEEEIVAKRFPNISIEPLDYGIAQSNLKNLNEIKVFETFDEYDNEAEILALGEIKDVGYYIFLEAKTKEIMSKAVNIAMLISLFVLLAALTAFLIIFFIVRRFLKPLNSLKEVALAVAKGDFKKRVIVNSNDEIGDLAQAFNSMTDKLLEEQNNVNQKIKERTEELEKTNRYMVNRELKMVKLKRENEKLKKDKLK